MDDIGVAEESTILLKLQKHNRAVRREMADGIELLACRGVGSPRWTACQPQPIPGAKKLPTA
jgi:hypothetical protein